MEARARSLMYLPRVGLACEITRLSMGLRRTAEIYFP